MVIIDSIFESLINNIERVGVNKGVIAACFATTTVFAAFLALGFAMFAGMFVGHGVGSFSTSGGLNIWCVGFVYV